MNNIFFKTSLALLLFLSACEDAPKADDAHTSEAQTVSKESSTATNYKVDLQKSNVQWIGTNPKTRHHGSLSLKEGNLSIEKNEIKNGHFVVDLNSLTAFDEDNSANSKIQTHLKGPDFFDVAKYGTATFEITSVLAGVNTPDKNLDMKDATHTITGNLKIKDVIKSVTFPATIDFMSGKLLADAVFNIDRTLWGINYKSDKSLGDKIINPDVNIKVHLEASK